MECMRAFREEWGSCVENGFKEGLAPGCAGARARRRPCQQLGAAAEASVAAVAAVENSAHTGSAQTGG